MIELIFSEKFPRTKKELKSFNKKNIREIDSGCLQELELNYRKYIDRVSSIVSKSKFEIIRFPIVCTTCKYIGPAFYHCHNPQASKYGINVSRNDVCKTYEPNIGLFMYLSDNASDKLF